ncbi:uncharacterized protein LOC110714491 [Chenopodium quinoa]|uniref:uncharacterized protein LOC110714491 n=1 Tax=Chenopodium quinoa TaxID=63459 RepID=UPI000B784550|nr:uncharacterized protein LOC110714491 [Chenopodium quinoa]
MVMDAIGHNYDRSGTEEEEPNAEAKRFLDLLKASEHPLYEGSSMSVLEVAARITSLKCEYNLPHRCVDGFVSLLTEAILGNNRLGETFYDVKKVVKGLELPHEKIHACPKGCMLFWKEDAELPTCRVCGSDRYKRTFKGSLVPKNALFYFPITSRLQRMFATKNISEEMSWHANNPRVKGTMAHPSDTEAWRQLDTCFPEFASDPRNVRLGLCTDGFSPHVPGPKNPKGKFRCVHATTDTRAETVVGSWRNDYPAYGMLSGWSTAGKKACPYCMEKSKAFWLQHGGKVSWFDSHRQFLPADHPFRKSKTTFCRNRVEKGAPPHIMSRAELWECVKDLSRATDGPESLQELKKEKKGWFKQSCLWELPYWKHLLIRNNLDVMHIEKNFFDKIFHTVMDVRRQTSDTPSARKDIAKYCRRPQLHLQADDRGNEVMPKAPFCLDKGQRKVLCEWVRDLRFPDGYASNLSRCVDLQACRIHGMKSHDCHVFMERLLPVALRELLPVHVRNAITEFSQFFRDLCCYTVTVSDMERLEKEHCRDPLQTGEDFSACILQLHGAFTHSLTVRVKVSWTRAVSMDVSIRKVIEEKPGSDVLQALAMGPFKKVRTWSRIFVSGFNFHTQDYGSQDGGEYFGMLQDIIEVVYTGAIREYKTILFKCSWMDCGKGMNIHEQYKLVEVNHTKKFPKYDPFVLSYQVGQVYYAPYPSLKRDRFQWWAVFKTQERSVVDAPVDPEFLQGTKTRECSTLCPPNDIPDYGDDGHAFVVSEGEDDDIVSASEDESSVGSSDNEEGSEEDEEDIVVFYDSTDDNSSDHCSSSDSNE